MGEFKRNFLRRLLLGIRAIYCFKRNFTIVFESKLYLKQILDLFISICDVGLWPIPANILIIKNR